MPLTELDPNTAGRSSRASNMSVGSKSSYRPQSPKTNLMSATPGVMSMLRTSTELGDIGTFSKPSSRRSAMHRPPRRGAGSPRPSTASSYYTTGRSQQSRSGMRPSTRSSAPYGRPSFTSSLNPPQSLNGSPSVLGYNDYGSTSSLIIPPRPFKDARSYSMTGSAHPFQPMSSHRSLTSLRSHAIRVQRSCNAYEYPPQVKRPGYRPSSPALSETTGVQRLRSQYLKTPLRRPLMVPPPLPPGPISSTSSESPSSDLPTPPKPCPSPDVHMNPVAEMDEGESASKLIHAETFHEANGSKSRASVQAFSFVQRIKSILNEKSIGSNECEITSSIRTNSDSTTAAPAVNSTPAPAPTAAPSSTVVKRITREMILEAIQPSSEKAGDDTTAAMSEFESQHSLYGDGMEKSKPSENEVEAEGEKAGTVQRTSTSTVNLTEDTRASTSDFVEGLNPVRERPEITINAPDDSDTDMVKLTNEKPILNKITHDSGVEKNDTTKIQDDQSGSSPTQITSNLSSSLLVSPSAATSGDHQLIDDPAIRFTLPKESTPILSSSSDKTATSISNIKIVKSMANDEEAKVEDTGKNAPLGKEHQNSRFCPPRVTSMERCRDSNTTTDLVLGSRLSFGAASINSEKSWAAKRVSTDATATDLRFSAVSQHSPLPGLKEESGEDISVQPRTFLGNFPLPGTMVFNRQSQGNRPSEGSKSIVVKPKSTNLKDSHDIPSLNFSRIDLFSKLNEALDLRSIDGLPFDVKDLYPSITDRPSSMSSVRQRYKSWFADYEDIFSNNRDSSMANGAARKSISPEHFISEVNQLSVPSVNVLTERLTELLPSIKDHFANSGEVIEKDVEDALEEIKSIGNRDSGMIVPENVSEGTELTLTAGMSRAQSRKQVNSLHSTKTWMSSIHTNKEGNDKGMSVSISQEPAPVTIHDGNKTKIKHLMPDVDDQEDVRSSSCEIEHVTPSTARPWNHSGYYPWVDNSMTIDICFPLNSKKTSSASPKPGHHKTISRSTVRSSEELDNSRKGNVKILRHSQSLSDIAKHANKASRRSILTSFSQRLGLHPPRDSNGNTINSEMLSSEERTVNPGDRYPTSALKPPSALNLEEVRSFFSDDSSQHEHVGNFRKRLTGRKSKRPHISRVFSTESRKNGNASNRSIFNYNTVNESNNRLGNNNSENTDRSRGSFSALHASGISTHSFPATGGMSKVEFRARKVVEKVKTFWFRGGELLRSMSGKNRSGHCHGNLRDTEQLDQPERWLDDSDINLNE